MSEEQKILESLNLVNINLKAIGKNQKGYNYKFRGIDDVLNSLNPLFKEFSIITLRKNIEVDRIIRPYKDKYGKDKEHVEVFLKCEYVFKSLIDGSEVVSSGFGEGQDSSGGDKASSMATSNSYKYVIFEMFNISTDEQKDSDQRTAIIAKQDTRNYKPDMLLALIEQSGTEPTEKTCTWVDNLPKEELKKHILAYEAKL